MPMPPDDLPPAVARGIECWSDEIAALVATVREHRRERVMRSLWAAIRTKVGEIDATAASARGRPGRPARGHVSAD